jgi:type I restriction enzyme S subunit
MGTTALPNRTDQMVAQKPETVQEPDDISIEDLPEGWLLTSVGKLFQIVGGGTPSTKIPEYWEGDIPWITSADIYGVKNIVPRRTINQNAIKNSAANLVPKGSIIVVTRVSLGRIAICDTPISFSQDCHALIPKTDSVDPEFALHYLSQAVQSFKNQSRGTTISGVTVKVVSSLPFLLPPLAEQQRIVVRVEALLSHVKAARERLSRVPVIMKGFRQAVLAAACSGRLTEGWRVENPEKLSTSDVVDFINAHKKKISDPLEEIGDYPETWISIKIGDLFDNWGGATPSTSEPSFWGGDIPWVSSKDIKSLRITQGSDFITKKALEGSRLRLSPIGSVLVVVRSGILAHTFPVAITDEEVVINQDIKAFYTPNQSLNEWLALFFRGQSRYILENIRKDGTTVQSIRFDDLKNMVLFVPSFDEQHEIVRRVNTLFERTNAIDLEVVTATKRTEALTQAVLGKAFRGNLVQAGMADVQT